MNSKFMISMILMGLIIIGMISAVSGSGVTGYGIEGGLISNPAQAGVDMSGEQDSTLQNAFSASGAQDTTGAITTYPVKPMAGGTITFSLSGSYPAGTVFSWTFGDGVMQNSTASSVQHQYGKTGVYQVSVATNSIPAATKTLDLTLMKGDLLVHAGEGIISAIIPGVWSHVGMYIGNDTILESTADGVHKSSISAWSLPGDTCVAAFRLPGISNQTRENIVTWALQMEHHPYDFLSILGYTKQPDCQSLTGFRLCYNYYCSELVWAAYYRNGINLDPIPGAVLPRTVVSGKSQPTELVGAHIEKVPAAFRHYQKYYTMILQGLNPPYPRETTEEESNFELIIIGTNENTTMPSDSNPLTESMITNNSSSPEMLDLVIEDPENRVLSAGNSTIPNSSIGYIDVDGDGEATGDMAGLFNPVPGEYLLNISLTNQTTNTEPVSLGIGVWDADQYSWVTPYNETALNQIPDPVYFRIAEQELSRTITIPSRGQAPLNVSFIDLALIGSVNNTWYFGDGTTASDMLTTSHQYTIPGEYLVTLVSWNNETMTNISFPVVVEEIPIPLKADFTADPVSGTPPLQVNFTDISTGYPVSWNWTFGDGTGSHEQNPIHTYAGIGGYTVTLEITNVTGDQSVIRKPRYITPDSGQVAGPNGMIWISSSPSDAGVFVDQAYAGATPLRTSGIPAGIRQIRVSKEGYRDWIGYVQISQGSYTYVPKVVLWKV